MSPRFSTALRILAVLLLALAVSPLTAPFSTTHAAHLFGASDAGDGPLVGARKAPDEPTAGLDGRAAIVLLGRVHGAREPEPAHGTPRGRGARHVVLRI